jgi:transcription elongation factor Elf1
MAKEETQQYYVPYFDCPVCGEVNDGHGQDDLSGEQKCRECGTTIEVTG